MLLGVTGAGLRKNGFIRQPGAISPAAGLSARHAKN